MNFRKLITYLTMGTAAVIPFAGAQNPTILQGNYITNVFGNSNFVLNPNALTNVANVAVSNATVTRSATTPLVATSEFLVTVTSANGTIAWNTRTFDQGMKGQNCEARFTYRGFQSTSVAQVRQGATVAGANVVARLALTPSTDPRIASINFPCGDLSQPTYFVITDTATLSGTHEIGGIYVGLATNMANVAQAENVVQATKTNSQSTVAATMATLVFNSEKKDAYGEFDTSNGRFTAKRAGDYLINSGVLMENIAWTAGQYLEILINKNGTAVCRVYKEVQASQTIYLENQINCTITLAVGDYVETAITQDRGNTSTHTGADYTYTNIYRFPSSSELVVTPERQNVFGGVVYTAGEQTLHANSAPATAYSSYNAATWNQPTMLKGRASVTTTNSGNDLGFSIANLPVGQYKLELSGLVNAQNSNSTTAVANVRCNFRLIETTTSTTIASQAHQDQSYANVTADESRDYINSFFGTFNNTAVATRNFRLEAQKVSDDTASAIGRCQAFANNVSNQLNTYISMLLTPLDQPSNSALYVQGPVLGAQTGAAIPAGYVGENLSCSFTGVTITTAQTDLCTISNVTPGVYLAYMAADATQGSSTRVAGFTQASTGTATVSWSTAAFQEWMKSAEAGSIVFQGVEYGRVTVGGTITFRALSYVANATSARGKINLVRLN